MTSTFVDDFYHMSRLFFTISISLCLLSFAGNSQARMTVEEYIGLYKDMAVAEMVKYNIPASITLAQGILESENGNSALAQKANNHFGIKCHKEWTGKTYYQDDEEKDECFRKYGTVEDSYRDHSEFLTTRDRYKPLFDLEITDYKGWAYGLKEAGYATNTRYPEILIRIIEENGLDKLDNAGSRRSAAGGRQSAVSSQQSAVSSQQSAVRNLKPSVFEIAGRGGNDRIIFVNNGVKFILAREGDTFFSIAAEFGIYSWQVYRYNDLTKQDELFTGQKVYLEKKKRKANVGFYMAGPGESLYAISQDYGIRLKALCRLNNMAADSNLAKGEKVRMR